MRNIKNSFILFLKEPAVGAGLVMVVGGNIANALNYAYHFIMAPLLGIAVYGELAAMLSVLGLLSIIPASLNLTVVKFIASTKKDSEVSGLIYWLGKRLVVLSLLISFLMILLSPPLSAFLNIPENWLMILVGISFFFMLPSNFYRSGMQGLLRFNEYVISLIVENSFKLLFGFILVYMGFGVFGAGVGLVLSMFLGFVISLYFLREYAKPTKFKRPHLKPLFLYSIPVIVQMLTTTSLYSTDVILVKHFFNAHDAGIYAGTSLISRIIFFLTTPISAVMFPMVAKSHNLGGNYMRTFLLCLLATMAAIGFVLVFYGLFPQIMVKAMYRKPDFAEVSNYLLPFGIFIGLFSLSSLITNFFLSIGKTKIVVFPAIAAISQIVGIWFFHTNLVEVITVSIITCGLLLFSILVYYFYTNYFQK